MSGRGESSCCRGTATTSNEEAGQCSREAGFASVGDLGDIIIECILCNIINSNLLNQLLLYYVGKYVKYVGKYENHKAI